MTKTFYSAKSQSSRELSVSKPLNNGVFLALSGAPYPGDTKIDAGGIQLSIGSTWDLIDTLTELVGERPAKPTTKEQWDSVPLYSRFTVTPSKGTTYPDTRIKVDHEQYIAIYPTGLIVGPNPYQAIAGPNDTITEVTK